MKKIVYIMMVVILLVTMAACSNVQSDEEDDDRERPKSSDVKNKYDLISAYNQAYQENYEPDSLEYILDHAKDSYVLLDFSGEDLSDFIDELHENDNEVSAYISIGTGEKWRDDFDELEPYLTDIPWDEWEDEFFVNEIDSGIVEVMKRRIDAIADMGFDWVEFDNMDWAFDDDNIDIYEIEVSNRGAIRYYTELCEYAHDQGLKCMAKNLAVDVEDFDGATYESYSDDTSWWDDEDELIDIVNEGKVVLIVHYDERDSDEAYDYYTDIYGDGILFISEDRSEKAYKHYEVD